ncbi:MAG: hypothetical protein RIB52_01965 [Erythrobacter sp.]|uniref:hypothetical protein n=1 Tax=Erythrobacter sp. TaxID=1042 RepID=UPI0032EDBCC8
MSGAGNASDPLGREARELNSRAFAALIGWEREWQRPLVDLLRSEHEIGPAVRNAIADLLEEKSPFGMRLKMSGHERSARWWDSIKDRQEWFVFGAEVAPYIEKASNLLEGIENASDALGRSEAYCKKCYYYRRDCQKWMHRAKREGRTYAAMNENLLSLEFHIASSDQKTLKPTLLDGQEFDRFFAARLRPLIGIRDVLNFDVPDDLSDGLVSFLYIVQRVPEQTK